MTVLTDVTRAQRRLGTKIDLFVANKLTPLYVSQTRRVKDQAELLALAVREVGTENLTTSRLRRLATLEMLATALQASVQVVSNGMVGALQAEYDDYVIQGFEDASDWMQEQRPADDYSGAVLIVPSNDNVFDQEAFYIKWGTLAAAMMDSLEQRLLERLPGASDPERVVEEEVDRVLGNGLLWGIGMVNMALQSFYRTGSERFIAGANIPGWYWVAVLDNRTCLSCVVLHGTWHPHWEQLNDHPRGRCVAVPAYEGAWGLMGGGLTGTEWFDQLDSGTQREMMGGSMFRAWQAGDVSYDDMSVETQHDVYGAMRRRASLTEILGPQRASGYRAK